MVAKPDYWPAYDGEGTRRVIPKVSASQPKWTNLTSWKESVVYAVRSDTIAKTVRIGVWFDHINIVIQKIFS